MQKKDKTGRLELVRREVKVSKEKKRGDISRKGTFLLEDVQFDSEVSKGARRAKDNNIVN